MVEGRDSLNVIAASSYLMETLAHRRLSTDKSRLSSLMEMMRRRKRRKKEFKFPTLNEKKLFFPASSSLHNFKRKEEKTEEESSKAETNKFSSMSSSQSTSSKGAETFSENSLLVEALRAMANTNRIDFISDILRRRRKRRASSLWQQIFRYYLHFHIF